MGRTFNQSKAIKDVKKELAAKGEVRKPKMQPFDRQSKRINVLGNQLVEQFEETE